jgi:hypothetical protein
VYLCKADVVFKKVPYPVFATLPKIDISKVSMENQIPVFVDALRLTPDCVGKPCLIVNRSIGRYAIL